MNYIILALSALILVIAVVAVIFCKLYKKYKKNYEQEHTKLLDLEKEYTTLVEAYKIKKKNKEKADEKIDNLHNGDAVNNAINILRK